jgi:hypothetical protein
MVKYFSLWLIMVMLCLAAEERVDLLQAGYRAYQHADYATAIDHYEQAQRQSSDPGRLAYELGCIQAEAGRYTDAALSFTRCMEDAIDLQRARAAYGLATALTHVGNQQRSQRAVATLQSALQAYDMALREVNSLTLSEPSLKADLEANRSIAQALLAEKQKDPPEPPEEQPVPTPPTNALDQNPGNDSGNRATHMNRNNTSAPGKDQGDSDTNPGRGNLPPLPDAEQTPPITPEEAQRRLADLMKRLRQPHATAAVKPGTKDW